MEFQGYTTDLFQPTYPTAQFGDWQFKNIITGGDRGYWGDMYGMRPLSILVGPSVEGESSWMSMAAVELESQEIGIRAARGNVVVLGLGMGSKKPDWDESTQSFLPVTEAEITLSFDHRILDGGAAGRLLHRVATLLQSPQDL